MTEDIIEILRVIRYRGTRKAVEEQVKRSLHGTRKINLPSGTLEITAATLDEFPKVILDAARVEDSFHSYEDL